MVRPRFKSLFSRPPSGCYEYGLDGVVVSDRYKAGICAKVRSLRASKGLDTLGDGFAYVMEYMCPSLPDGFCTTPSPVKVLQAEEIKTRTAALFRLPCATFDDVNSRLSVCVSCPKNIVRGFCLTCTGLLTWIYRGYGGRRPPCPADAATGACACDRMLTAAVATAASFPLTDGAEYPAGCWRTKGRDASNG